MDRRERDHNWFNSFDEKAMTVNVGEEDEGQNIPVRYEVCGTCDGKGSHVNPSIDADHGITREEFDEDPDFKESYFRGDYDQPCNECGGRRVAPVVDTDRATPAQVQYVESWIQDMVNYAAECAAERRMGA